MQINMIYIVSLRLSPPFLAFYKLQHDHLKISKVSAAHLPRSELILLEI